MATNLMNFNGNPNVGLYGVVTDKFVLLGKEISESHHLAVSKAFDMPVHPITVAGTSLLGVFCLWTGSKLLVPHIIFDSEVKVLKDLGLTVVIIRSDLTCIGNNILLGPKGAIINPEFSDDDSALISDALGIPIFKRSIVGMNAVGSLAVVRKNFCLIHRDISSSESKEVSEELGVSLSAGTVNLGGVYIKSGILLGEVGMLIGDASGGPEIVNAEQALGFIDG